MGNGTIKTYCQDSSTWRNLIFVQYFADAQWLQPPLILNCLAPKEKQGFKLSK